MDKKREEADDGEIILYTTAHRTRPYHDHEHAIEGGKRDAIDFITGLMVRLANREESWLWEKGRIVSNDLPEMREIKRLSDDGDGE